MAKSNNIEKKIKESFESVKHKAPENLWSNINDSLFPNATDLDNKIKTSFEDNTDKAPDGIWEGIDKQLTIDKGWTRVHKILQRRTFYKWTKRVAAFMIFLFFTTPEFGDEFPGKTEVKLSSTENSFVEKEIKQSPAKNQNKDLKTARLNNKFSSEDTSNPSGEEENFIYNNLPVKSNEPLRTDLVDPKKESLVNADYIVNLEQKDEIIKSETESNEKNTLDFRSSFELTTLPVKSISSLKMDNENRELIDIEIELSKETKYEFGLFTAVNSTAIINNKTRRALDSKSLIAFNPSMGTNLGLQFVYHFKEKHGVVGNLTYANVNQSYGSYSKGSFDEEMLTTNFVRLQGMYHFRYKRFEISKTSLNLKFGPYVGLMTSSSYSVNGVVKKKFIEGLQNYDFGVTLQLGQSYEFNKLVLDYGLNMDKGLANLNMGTNKVPASFDRSTILGLGGYISLRYRF